MFTPFEAIALIVIGFIMIALIMLIGWAFGASIRQDVIQMAVFIGALCISLSAVAWKLVYTKTGDDVSVLGAMGIVIVGLVIFAAIGVLGEVFAWGLRSRYGPLKGYSGDRPSTKYASAAVIGVPVLVAGLGVIAFPILVG